MTKNTTTTNEYQKAIEYIYQMIKNGNLIVGSKIPSERDISETLGIGRNSTREALSILRGMGLIESVHGSGNYISKDCGRSIWGIVSVMLSLGSITIKDIMECRRVLAKSVIDLIFSHGLSTDEKKHLEDVLTNMATASEDELIQLDQEYHVTLIRATKNPLFITLIEAIAEICNETMTLVLTNSEQETKDQFLLLHQNIYYSIIEDKKDDCLQHLSAHYDLAESYL
jgi:GntR family transcriptional repressor for pyruvate dehydrogenase complex